METMPEDYEYKFNPTMLNRMDYEKTKKKTKEGVGSKREEMIEWFKKRGVELTPEMVSRIEENMVSMYLLGIDHGQNHASDEMIRELKRANPEFLMIQEGESALEAILQKIIGG